jgi:hypothetical protein
VCVQLLCQPIYSICDYVYLYIYTYR